jgi:hypothetical protein
MYVWGGLRDLLGPSRALWRLPLQPGSLGWREEQQVGAVPPARHRHAAALQEERLYIHGGERELRSCRLLHRLHLPSLTWEELPGTPPPLRGHALLARGAALLLLGKRHTWTFRPATAAWRKEGGAGPAGRPLLLGGGARGGHHNPAYQGEGEAREGAAKGSLGRPPLCSSEEREEEEEEEVTGPVPDLLMELTGSRRHYRLIE